MIDTKTSKLKKILKLIWKFPLSFGLGNLSVKALLPFISMIFFWRFEYAFGKSPQITHANGCCSFHCFTLLLALLLKTTSLDVEECQFYLPLIYVCKGSSCKWFGCNSSASENLPEESEIVHKMCQIAAFQFMVNSLKVSSQSTILLLYKICNKLDH